MKKNRIILLFLYLVPIGSISAQQLSPFVVSSSGGFYSNDSGMLSFTTSEMSAVETFTSPSAILTQGFQQPWDFGTSINENPDLDFSIGIYPNPTNGDFNLLTESLISARVDVIILDVLGREVLKKEFYHQSLINVQSFDLSNAVQGIYMIAITVKENNSSSPEHHFIRKIHISK